MGTIAKVTAGGDTHLIQTTAFATCPTAANVVAKVATIQDSQVFALIDGITIHVKFTNSNTVANPTLNVNNTGAIAIKRYGTTAPSTSAPTSWNAGAVVSLTFDGTYWQMNDWNNTDIDVSNLVITAGQTLSNIYWYGGAFLTNSSQELYTSVTFKNIILASNVTVSNIDVVTRQNNKYTHGSSASAGVPWNVIEARPNAHGISLELSRTTVTNAVNNSAVGVRIHATYAFS